MALRLAKETVQRIANAAGYTVSRTSPVAGAVSFDGMFRDTASDAPRINCEPGEPVWYAGKPVIFSIDDGHTVLRQEVLYSSLTLLKMLKHFNFTTVLDIGSHAGNVARVLTHAGKKVTTCEIAPGYEADYKADFLDIQFPEKFDAIWCSQTLEHQRNVGFFLNKVFDDLRDGGVLAVTVPQDVPPALNFGHCNYFSPLLVLYHLVMAGFDCRDASLLCYDNNIGVILYKSFNGINRSLPQGTLPATEATSGTFEIDGTQRQVRELLGDEIFEGMHSSFPAAIQLRHGGTSWAGAGINWTYPI